MSADFFERVKAAARTHLRELLFEAFPSGRVVGDEFIVGDFDGHPGSSFRFNLVKGVGCDFATGEKGADIIGVWARRYGLKPLDAALDLATRVGIPGEGETRSTNPSLRGKPSAGDETGDWQIVSPIPPESINADGTPKDLKLRPSGASHLYPYHSAAGGLLMYRVRIEKEGGGKDILPLTRWKNSRGLYEWRWGDLPKPRPLYGLEHLASRPDAPVLTVEGEKCADAGNEALPDWVSTTWPGGAKRVSGADWAPLRDRKTAIRIWPDADPPGYAAAIQVASLLPRNADVKIVVPARDWPEHHDIADLVAEGWDGTGLQAYIEEHSVTPDEFHEILHEREIKSLRELLDRVLEKLDADPGAPVEPEAVETTARLKELDRAEYARYEHQLKKRRFKIKLLEEALRERRRAKAHALEQNSFERSNEHEASPSGAMSSSCSNDSPDGSSDEAERLDAGALYEIAQDLIKHPDPLEAVRAAIRDSGYAGDTAPAELVYISLSSRHQQRPLNLHYMALSGSGKNFTVNIVLPFFPPDAFYALDASSPRALIYNEESFEHRIVVLSECDSIPAEGPAASAIRSITNDAVMSYETVEKNPETGHWETRRITKKGPTGLITTGVRPLDRQMATRTLQAPLPDSEDQTRQILRSEGKRAAQPDAGHTETASIEKLIAYQQWLACAGEKRVVVPFATALAELVPAREVRMRRDFKQLLTVIKTLAFLAQANRPRTGQGEVEATLVDYVRARRLLAPLFDSIAADGITPAVRETVESIAEGEEVSEADLVVRLNLAKSSVSYRVRRALRGGWLKNLETRRSHPAKLARGAPLPEEGLALPKVEDVRRTLESLKASNQSSDHSNANEPVGGEGRDAPAFECSNRSAGDPSEPEEETLDREVF